MTWEYFFGDVVKAFLFNFEGIQGTADSGLFIIMGIIGVFLCDYFLIKSADEEIAENFFVFIMVNILAFGFSMFLGWLMIIIIAVILGGIYYILLQAIKYPIIFAVILGAFVYKLISYQLLLKNIKKKREEREAKKKSKKRAVKKAVKKSNKRPIKRKRK